jgi:hypothetical protein
MQPDRTNWGAQEYADALNRAATPTELFELVEEVNNKWSASVDPEPRSSSSESSELSDTGLRIAS